MESFLYGSISFSMAIRNIPRKKCRSVLPIMQRTTNMDLSMSADIGKSGK
jgi:hypothetical protein